MCGGHSANTDCQVKKSHAGSLSGTAGLSKECKVTVVAWAQLPALEKVKLYKARYLVEMTVARQPDLLEIRFGPFCDPEAVHGYKHRKSSF
jgi:hypothetical protein